MSTPTVAEPSSACLDAAVTTASAPTGPAPPTPVDVAPLTGDSPSVGVGTPTYIKPEPAVAPPPPPLPPSVDPPAAAPVEMPPPSPTPAVVEAPPPQPPPMPSPSVREPTETAPARPPTTPPTPEVVAAAPEVRPTPAPESTAATVASAPQPAAQAAPLPSPELPSPASPKPDADKAVVADGPVPRTTAQPPRPTRRPVKLGLSGAPPFHQPSASSASSVTPTPSTSTVQSSVTSPRSEQPSGADDAAATSSSYGSVKERPPGSYLRAHQRRAAGTQRPRDGATTPGSSDAVAGPPGVDGGPAHERKSRSVSPSSQTDSCRSSTVTTSTMRTGTSATVHGSRGRSPLPPGLESPAPAPPLPAADWPRPSSPYYAAAGSAFSPRHPTEYRHCVAAEPGDVRPSRRARENTHSKLFGADQPDSPRSAAAAFAAAVGGHAAAEGLPPKPLQQRRVEDTQATLFGPPDPHRKSARVYPDTHQSLFGPPPVAGGPGQKPQQRRSRSCFQDTADLLRHDSAAGGRSDEDMRAMRGRYALRHQDTGDKIFGADGGVPRVPTPRPQRDHDIFLVASQPPAIVVGGAPPCAADPVASP